MVLGASSFSVSCLDLFIYFPFRLSESGKERRREGASLSLAPKDFCLCFLFPVHDILSPGSGNSFILALAAFSSVSFGFHGVGKGAQRVQERVLPPLLCLPSFPSDHYCVPRKRKKGREKHLYPPAGHSSIHLSVNIIPTQKHRSEDVLRSCPHRLLSRSSSTSTPSCPFVF